MTNKEIINQANEYTDRMRTDMKKKDNSSNITHLWLLNVRRRHEVRTVFVKEMFEKSRHHSVC